MLGLMCLIWKDRFRGDPTTHQRNSVKDLDEVGLLTALRDLRRKSLRRLLALDPPAMKRLLDQGTLKVSELFHDAEDLVMLKGYIAHLCLRITLKILTSLQEFSIRAP